MSRAASSIGITAESPATGSMDSASATPRHILAFEQPLARLEQQITELETLQAHKEMDCSSELRQLRENYTSLLKKTYDNLSAWEVVQVARHPQRPFFTDYISFLCHDFREIHGDRLFGDDPAIRCGLARLGGHKVMLIGHHKGKNTKERLQCNFGMANPEGYRKALRAMKIAEKFHLPVVTLVDTAGAYPGIGAEERGQAESIARNLMEMARLQTPIVTVITGEGGSGGALGIAVADRVAMMEYAWYSVISPEGASAILFKGNEMAPQMAESLKLTSGHLKRLGIIDAIIREPLGGAHRDPYAAAHALDQYLAKTLRDLKRCKIENTLERRYERFRNLGEYVEGGKHAKAAG